MPRHLPLIVTLVSNYNKIPSALEDDYPSSLGGLPRASGAFQM